MIFNKVLFVWNNIQIKFYGYDNADKHKNHTAYSTYEQGGGACILQVRMIWRALLAI